MGPVVSPEPYTQFIPIRPKVKSRPRAARNGRMYTPKTTIEFEQAIRAAYAGPMFEEPISIEIEFETDGFWITITPTNITRPKHLRRGDLDNYVKAVGDGLQTKAFTDDLLVHEIVTRFREADVA